MTEPSRPTRILKALMYSIALIALACFVYGVGQAWSHDAPTGWKYQYACCSGIDCREVPASWISEQPDGYHVPSGEVVGYLDTRVKDSPDGQTHWCSQGGSDTGRTICLFVPQRGM